MSFSINLGWNDRLNSYEAGKYASLQATENWQKNNTNLALVFASANYQQYKLIAGIREIIPDIPIVGCTAAATITPESSLDNGVILALISSDPNIFQYSWGLGKNVKSKSREAGYQATRMAINNFSKLSEKNNKVKNIKKNLLIFPDGVEGNGADILRGCQEIIGVSFSILGASAGDAYIFEKTFQYSPNGITSGDIVSLLIGGEINLGIGIKHGWKSLGKYRKVTKATGNIIKEIDNRPAISIYEDYFGDETKMLKEEPLSMMGMLYPVGMKIPEEDEYLLRNPFKVNKKGELICSAEVPEGSTIRLMISNRNNVLTAAQEAAMEAIKNLQLKKPKAIIVFSSISRKKLLGRNCYKEIETIKDIAGANIPIFGFYGYGELAPLRSSIYTGQSQFHNQAIVVSMLGV